MTTNWRLNQVGDLPTFHWSEGEIRRFTGPRGKYGVSLVRGGNTAYHEHHLLHQSQRNKRTICNPAEKTRSFSNKYRTDASAWRNAKREPFGPYDTIPLSGGKARKKTTERANTYIVQSNQSINQWDNQSITQSIKSINRSINQSIKSINRPLPLWCLYVKSYSPSNSSRHHHSFHFSFSRY